jgi:hypothetical protein
MTDTNRRPRKTLWALLAASALTLPPIAASAQTPPPDASAPTAAPTPAPEAESYPRMGKNHEIYVGTTTWFRFGLQAQLWADWLQSSTPVNGNDGGYSQNFFLRRARFMVGAQLLPTVSAYLLLDAPRIGQATAISSVTLGSDGAPVNTTTIGKRFTAQDGGGEGIADFWGEIKIIGDAFILDAGLMYVPFSRGILTSSTTMLTLDGGNTSALIPNTSSQRDLGLQLKGYLLEDHLEYRVGLFSGARQAANATTGNPIAHNFFRVAGYLQYDLFDTEKGYTYGGHYFGKKKILGIGVGADAQKNDAPQTDAYLALSAAVFGSWPLAGEGRKDGGDEIAFLAQYYHYDGGGTTGAVPALAKQDDFLGEVAYYNKDLGFGVFGKFELQKFGEAAKAGNTQWFGGGVRYYVYENVCNFTLAYNRARFPDAPTSGTGARNATNEITLQTQFYYY